MILYPIPLAISSGDLDASRLVATDASKVFKSVTDLTAWILDTANEINVINNADGTVTVALSDIINLGGSI